MGDETEDCEETCSNPAQWTPANESIRVASLGSDHPESSSGPAPLISLEALRDHLQLAIDHAELALRAAKQDEASARRRAIEALRKAIEFVKVSRGVFFALSLEEERELMQLGIRAQWLFQRLFRADGHRVPRILQDLKAVENEHAVQAAPRTSQKVPPRRWKDLA
jgi:hypothetical protein